MLTHLKKVHQVGPENVIIVDLREEPHGFINNHAITWYYGPLSYQHGKTPTQVAEEEERRIKFVKNNSHIIIYKITKHRDGMPFNKAPSIHKVDHVKSEKEIVEALGARYVRLPVTDHFRPENQDVDQFLELVATLKPTDWLHFKCRGGRGRTTTFMAMYDMIKNPDLKKQDIILRQTFIDGVDLTRVIKQQHRWKKKLNQDRIRFIEIFYEYVHARDGYGKMRWSDWILKHVPDSYDDDNYKVVD
jgi:protein-tyrosine phosphatase